MRKLGKRIFQVVLLIGVAAMSPATTGCRDSTGPSKCLSEGEQCRSSPGDYKWEAPCCLGLLCACIPCQKATCQKASYP